MWNAVTVPTECKVCPAYSYGKTWSGSGIGVDGQLVGILLVCDTNKYCESNGVKVLVNEHKFTSLQLTSKL